MWSIRIGCAVGVAVWLVVWLQGFAALLGVVMGGCFPESCGELTDMAVSIAIVGGAAIGVVAGLVAGWGTYAAIGRLGRRKA